MAAPIARNDQRLTAAPREEDRTHQSRRLLALAEVSMVAAGRMRPFNIRACASTPAAAGRWEVTGR